jgi:NADPH:quinone reductase
MKAVMASVLGAIEDLSVVDLPDPAPGPGEVLVAVRAAGVNYPDLLVVQGRYQNRPPLPFIPGKEAAGIVLAVGPGVDGCREGDRVLAFVEYGAYCEKLVTPASSCFVIPHEMDIVEAAAFGLAYQTAYFALVERANLKAGETVLVTGAAGGVGLACVQLAHALGARVIAAVSSFEKAELARSAGADAVIDLSPGNLRDFIRDEVRALTDGKGADVVCEIVGGDVFDGAIRAVAWSGRLVVLGFAGGRIPSISANYVLVKNIAVMGMHWSDYRDWHPQTMRRAQDALFKLYQQGKLRTEISGRYPIDHVTQALAMLRDRQVRGKVVLMMHGNQTVQAPSAPPCVPVH